MRSFKIDYFSFFSSFNGLTRESLINEKKKMDGEEKLKGKIIRHEENILYRVLFILKINRRLKAKIV